MYVRNFTSRPRLFLLVLVAPCRKFLHLRDCSWVPSPLCQELLVYLRTMKKRKVSPVQVELDLLWKELPEELLEIVISKLPFSKAAEFRVVCKRWKNEVVPRATRDEESREHSFLYFDTKCKPFPRWMKLSKSENVGTSCRTGSPLTFEPAPSFPTGSLLTFEPAPSFPTLGRREHVQLVNSKGGLLFFALFKNFLTLRAIVAYNPLTVQSRTLGLPRPLRCRGVVNRDSLIGVVMDAKTQNYIMVVAGYYEAEQETTFLYKSSSSTWVTGPSLSRKFRDIGINFGYLFSSQSICHDGNLYWYALFTSSEDCGRIAIMFDVLKETWTILDKERPYLLESGVQELDMLEGFPKDEEVYPANCMWDFAPSLTSLP